MNKHEIKWTPELMRADRWSILALAILVMGSIGLDQITKYAAEKNLMIWSSNENLKEYQGKRFPIWQTGSLSSTSTSRSQFYLSFSLNYVRNQGAAWGFLSDWDDVYRVPFFYVVTLVAVIIIFLYLYSTPHSHRLARFTLALILSGAIGNFIDRVWRGYVIDFLDFRWVLPLPLDLNLKIDFFPSYLDFFNFELNTNAWKYNFPNFNWADSMITVGVIFLIFDMIVLEYLRKNRFLSESSNKI